MSDNGDLSLGYMMGASENSNNNNDGWGLGGCGGVI